MAGDAVAALEAMLARVKAAGPEIAFGGALLVEGAAKRHASGPHTETTVGVDSGDLRRSIKAHDAEEIGPDLWSARTFPSEIYARIQELGGHMHAPGSYPGAKGAKYMTWIGPDGRRRFAKDIDLPARPYLGPGREDSIGPYWELAKHKIEDALGV